MLSGKTRGWSVLTLALALVAPGAAAIAQVGGDAAKALEKAAVERDLPGVEQSLAQLWSSDRERAREMAWALMTNGAEDQRPIALASFAANATTQEIVQVVNALNVNRNMDARLLLVRMLGYKGGDEAVEAARVFVRDRHPLVRAAAARSLADLGDVASVEMYVRKLRMPPSETLNWRGDDSEIEQMAMYGALRTLTGVRPANNRDALQWVKDNANLLETMTPPAPEDPAKDWTYKSGLGEKGVRSAQGSEKTLETPSFKVFFDMGSDFSRNMADQAYDLGELSVEMEKCASAALRAAEPIFGKAHLPPIRLTLANEQTIAKSGGPSRGYAGFASGNKIVLRFDSMHALRSTLTHEYVHIIHQAHYENQPRWLAEGIAESLFKSAQGSVWAGAGAGARARLGDAYTRGLVGEALKWDNSGSSNEDSGLYALGHAVVDYLRFGPFTAREARLAELMGRLSRGEHPKRAVEALYGPVAELDAGIRAWIEGGG